jgi:hypothetical protein
MPEPDPIEPTPEDIERAGNAENLAMLTAMANHFQRRAIDHAARLAATERACPMA